ncbi:hypothetical protein M9458_010925 [Cirrhinus mrigala]|uniref:Reverse transcriptase/retrotransposon-derived protein RNase H-like domain-containing protein n=1 Tax=Cirrhinus mrigala TaxID=683832 RepID=A0ABD0R2A6_CIRMR
MHTLQVGLFHKEDLRFLVLEDSTISVILGYRWLHLRTPKLRWDPCDITRWNKQCYDLCLSNLPLLRSISVLFTQIESPEPQVTPEIPAEYRAFQDVFSKQAATRLPPHRPWDRTIELLPGAQLPKGRIYPLSIPECRAMEEYIAEALQQAFIQPSILPATSSFFFVGKKVPEVYKVAEGVEIDQGKVQDIQEWPTPNTVKELQRFLGFSNFYRRLIQNYSIITALLTSLLRGKPKHIIWSPTAHEAFQRLKTIFCTAPLLRHPDPDLPFTVEVDASTTGVGAVLSQVVGESPLLHPCAFFSHKLSPAEQNYDVGNRELLPVKLALEEWHHWLEGATHHFSIITDHKNLQYLREAKRLNAS